MTLYHCKKHSWYHEECTACATTYPCLKCGHAAPDHRDFCETCEKIFERVKTERSKAQAVPT